MCLRRAIQLAVLLIYWTILVPLVREYLVRRKWMKRHKWTTKRLGFYGIAAFVFVFVYVLAMLSYAWYKRYEQRMLDELKASKKSTPTVSQAQPAPATAVTPVQTMLERVECGVVATTQRPPLPAESKIVAALKENIANKKCKKEQVAEEEWAAKRSKLRCWRYPYANRQNDMLDLDVQRNVEIV